MGAPAIPPFLPTKNPLNAPSIVLLGDSITALAGQPFTTSNGVTPDNGWFNWAQIFLNQSLLLLNNAGVTGNTTAQMLARIATDVLPYKPQMVSVLGGINDIISTGGTFNSITATLKSIYQTLNNQGIAVLASTLMPYNVQTFSANTVAHAFFTASNGNITVSVNTLPSGVNVGNTFTLTGMTSSGGSGASYNGTYTALAGTNPATGILVGYKGADPGTYTVGAGGALVSSCAAINLLIQEINDWIRAYCWSNPGMTLVDFHTAMVNPASTDGVSQPLYLRAADNLHPSPLGARIAGLAFANTVSPLISAAARHTYSQCRTRLNGAMSQQLLHNPLFLGSGGTLYNNSSGGVAPSGTVAADWTAGVNAGTPTVVCSTGSDVNGFGNAQILACTAFSAADQPLLSSNTTDMVPYVNVGDYVQAECYVQLSNMVNVKGIWFYLYVNNPGQVNGVTQTLMPTAASVGEYGQANWSGFIRTPVMTIPNIAISNVGFNLIVEFFGGGSATIAVSRASVWDYGATPPAGLNVLPGL